MTSRNGSEQDAEHESHNIIVLAAHQILIRIAWVFKTESVIMPAFMDQIAGAGWLRGCLPVLSRLGLSVPPLLLADKLKHARRKKWTLMTSSLVMAVPFLILSGIWIAIDDKRQPWLPFTFLILYLFFFSAVGINQLAFGTIQGKLIRADRRGILMSLSGVVGTFFSVASLLWLLKDWLEREDGFGLIFGFTGMGFLIGGASVAMLKESADKTSVTKWVVIDRFQDAWRIFVQDTSFRRLAVVAMCFCPLMLLFPHFQALGRRGDTIQASATDLMVWVVVQNVAVGIYSLIAGYLADRFGNRLVLRGQLFIGAVTPLVALTLSGAASEGGSNWFWLTFGLLGVAPVTLRTLMNFNLELTDSAGHPRYVSTLSLCSAIPFLASPLVGYFVDLIGFAVVFAGSSAIIAAGFLLTFRLPEPRQGAKSVL